MEYWCLAHEAKFLEIFNFLVNFIHLIVWGLKESSLGINMSVPKEGGAFCMDKVEQTGWLVLRNREGDRVYSYTQGGLPGPGL